MIEGNIEGIKKTVLMELESLLDYQIESDKILDENSVNILLDITDKINKEILIIIDNSNRIIHISVGDSKTAVFPEIKKRTKKRGLSELVSFHTHPNGNPSLSTVDVSSLKSLKFNLLGAMARNKNNGKPLFNIGTLYINNDSIDTREYGPLTLNQLNKLSLKEFNKEVDKYLRINFIEDIGDEEIAILIGVNSKTEKLLNIEDSMNELQELTITAGAVPIQGIIQNRENVDATFYIGKGKLEELKLIIQNKGCNLVICNDELNSLQIKVMETYLGVKVIDRTSLILEIFARHARTSEGKLQVELAQLKYRLPRLLGLGKVLSRTGGGIGTRGPGEKKLEVDRRLIYKQINILENKIKSLRNVRAQQKTRRVKNQIPIVSLVGYTNAGKSTLFNLLTDSSVLSENKLFATLDSTTRKFRNMHRDLLLSDTVGFIDKLPHDLIKAFQSTLEDVDDSNLLLHVIDSSNINFLQQIKIVNNVLETINCENKKCIYVFNKVDKKCEDFDLKYSTIKGSKILISAKYETGISELIEQIKDTIFADTILKEVKVPYDNIKTISRFYDIGIVDKETYEEDFIRLEISYTKDMEYIINKNLKGD